MYARMSTLQLGHAVVGASAVMTDDDDDAVTTPITVISLTLSGSEKSSVLNSWPCNDRR